MGGCDMDLRRAEIEGPEVEITAVVFWGGVNIIVPEGFDVELQGFSFMGGRELKLRDVPIVRGSPRIVRAWLLDHGRHCGQEPAEPFAATGRPVREGGTWCGRPGARSRGPGGPRAGPQPPTARAAGRAATAISAVGRPMAR